MRHTHGCRESKFFGLYCQCEKVSLSHDWQCFPCLWRLSSDCGQLLLVGGRKDMSRAYILFGRHYLSSHIIKYEPSLLHFCSVHHKQMLRSTVRWHSSHITLQHHKNLQLHLSITVSMVVR